jgi:hypothetical protein
MNRPLVVLTLLVWGKMSFSQDCSRIRTVDRKARIVEADVIPGSLTVEGMSDSLYSVVYLAGSAVVEFSGTAAPDSVGICYHRLPKSLLQPYSRRSIRSYDSVPYRVTPPANPFNVARESLLPSSGFEKSGSVSREISFGNHRNMAPMSSLNFQMEGKLGPDLRLRATITDRQMPYQPEGNTQNLQGLDNIFIELSGSKFTLVGGDVLAQRSTQIPGFLRYSRNIQGLTLTVGGTQGRTFFSAGAMKGRFTSTILEVVDGTLGPYRITAPQSEGFVTILANSERVYLDGQLLHRGFNADYVIDYNLGEIQFTSRILITRYSRVRVEYEYTNLAYPRSLLSIGHERKGKRGTVAVEYYHESDSPNRSFYSDLTLSPTVASTGSVDAHLVMPKADSTGFRSGTIQYKKEKRVLGDGSEVTVWKYSVNPDSAHYSVRFSFVGQGRGNYIEAGVVAFGKIYAWVEPDAAGPRGSYEPGISVPPPSRKQMITLNGSLKAGEYESLSTELASSSTDTDLLTGNAARGAAYKLSLSTAGRALPIPGWRLMAGANAEVISASFAPVDRYRDVEFDRDWSVTPVQSSAPSQEGLFQAHISAVDSIGNLLGYTLGVRHRKGYRGVQQSGKLVMRHDKWALMSDLFLLDAESTGEVSTWRKWTASVRREGRGIAPGYSFRTERNVARSPELPDTVISSAGYFTEHLAFVNIDRSEKGFVRLSQAFRTDFIPLDGTMTPFTRSSTTQASSAWTSGSQRVDLAVNVRDIEYLTTVDASDQDVSGRADWRGSFAKNAVRTEVAYSAGSGRELKKNYGFVPVPVGQGTHTWRDNNANGLAELDEFFEAINPDERSHIRMLLPTPEYVPAFSSLISARLTADMPRAWRSATGFRKLASLLSFAANLNRDARTSSQEFYHRLTGGWGTVARSHLIGGKQQFRSALYINRASPKYGAELSYADHLTQRTTTLGWESTGQSGWWGMARVALASRTVLKLSGGQGTRSSGSDYLQGRSYRYTLRSLKPELIWTPLASLRLSGYWQTQYKGEKPEPAEHPGSQAKQSEAGLEARWFQGDSGSLQAEVRSSYIDFTGVEQSALGYDLLGGLRPGRNFVCTVNWTRKLVNGLQLQLSYDGRKSPGMEVVHLGRVSVSALF